MGEALRLARLGEGFTRPNPPVGAVVVKAGRAVGRGYHRVAGGAHAEVLALREAGTRARGATLYVTLEPCSTWGRTPPCTELILRMGVRRVVAAVADPNPRHRGRGLRMLRARGVQATLGVGKEEAERILQPFAKHIRQGLPYVTLKLAASIDGKIADATGRSRWITGAAARREVQALRRRVDAMVVGARTAVADNPSLLPKGGRTGRPYRVIVDARGAVPLTAAVFCDGRADQTVIATTSRCPRRLQQAYRDTGAQVWVLPQAGTRVSTRSLVSRLGRAGVLHALCEGGGELAASLIAEGVVDELLFFMAPCVIGGRNAPGAIGGVGWPLASRRCLEFVEITRVGPDLMIRARPLQTGRRSGRRPVAGR